MDEDNHGKCFSVFLSCASNRFADPPPTFSQTGMCAGMDGCESGDTEVLENQDGPFFPAEKNPNHFIPDDRGAVV